MKIKLNYPVIRFNTIEVEMTEDEYDELKGKPYEEQAKFIMKHNDNEDLPELTDEKLIVSALDTDYATIRQCQPEPVY